MSAGPTHLQLIRGRRRMAEDVAHAIRQYGYTAKIERAARMKPTDRGDGFGPCVKIIRRGSDRLVGWIRCTSIHASNGEAAGWYSATRTSDGRTHGTISRKEALRWALGPEAARVAGL